ncbi:MAG: FAD-dependent oxidoreductase, partial [Planctomycetota bacterium]
DPRYNADATRHGGFVMPSAARLEAAAFLDATLDWLRSSGRLYEWSLDALNDLQLAPPRVLVPELNLAARVVVDCRGFTAADPLFTDSPALTPLKGEVLVVEGPGLPDDRVVHRGVWLVPVERGRGDEGQTRCLLGATYTPDDATSHPTPVGRAELLASLREFLSGEPRVVGHRAGVRPALPDRKPVAIISKADDRFACFNGLGAKGALSAPWHAGRLAEKLAALVRC